MIRRRLLGIAILGEGALAAIGLAWMAWRSIPLQAGPVLDAIGAGLATAAGLAVLSYYCLHYAPALGPIRSIRRVHRDLFRPLFADVRPPDILVISAAAGTGEELLFRGAIQAEWGLVAASLLFGLVHTGARHMVGFGIWAAAVGALLGWLARATGGLLAPIVAHGVYDALAIAYIRYADRRPSGTGTATGPQLVEKE